MAKTYHDWKISKHIKSFSLRAEQLRHLLMSKGVLLLKSTQAGINDKLTNEPDELDPNSQRIVCTESKFLTID